MTSPWPSSTRWKTTSLSSASTESRRQRVTREEPCAPTGGEEGADGAAGRQPTDAEGGSASYGRAARRQIGSALVGVSPVRKWTVILLHAFVGWALCGAIMGVGMAVMSVGTTLIVHAIGAPLVFALVSWSYFDRSAYTTPLQTAMVFFLFALLMDVFVAGLLIQRSLDMFRSALGTWIPLALSFASTYAVGVYVTRRQR